MTIRVLGLSVFINPNSFILVASYPFSPNFYFYELKHIYALLKNKWQKKRQTKFCTVFKQPAILTGNSLLKSFSFIDSLQQLCIGPRFPGTVSISYIPSCTWLQINAFTNEEENTFFVDEYLLIFDYLVIRIHEQNDHLSKG